MALFLPPHPTPVRVALAPLRVAHDEGLEYWKRRTWKDGILEDWNDGYPTTRCSLFPHFSLRLAVVPIIPTFHYSITPMFVLPALPRHHGQFIPIRLPSRATRGGEAFVRSPSPDRAKTKSFLRVLRASVVNNAFPYVRLRRTRVPRQRPMPARQTRLQPASAEKPSWRTRVFERECRRDRMTGCLERAGKRWRRQHWI
jgi:hypothetical protein